MFNACMNFYVSDERPAFIRITDANIRFDRVKRWVTNCGLSDLDNVDCKLL